MILIIFQRPFVPYDGTLIPGWTDRGPAAFLIWTGGFIRDLTGYVNKVAAPYSPKGTIYSSQSELTWMFLWAIGANAININLIRYADILLWAAEPRSHEYKWQLAKAQTTLTS
jgi:hypothetical protein